MDSLSCKQPESGYLNDVTNTRKDKYDRAGYNLESVNNNTHTYVHTQIRHLPSKNVDELGSWLVDTYKFN